jgi:hypothetical protein
VHERTTLNSSFVNPVHGVFVSDSFACGEADGQLTSFAHVKFRSETDQRFEDDTRPGERNLSSATHQANWGKSRFGRSWRRWDREKFRGEREAEGGERLDQSSAEMGFGCTLREVCTRQQSTLHASACS